jgi:membrane associated rhomboid family serine protease
VRPVATPVSLTSEVLLQSREPIFNVPGVILAVLGLLILVHLALSMLPAGDALWWLVVLAFIPARYSGMASEIPGGDLAAFTSPFTHMLVHADALHLGLNALWLLAFGTGLARRLGPLRFLAFTVAGGLAGALAFFAAHPDLAVPVIGASGAVSAMMGGVMRFLFTAIDRGEGHLLRDRPTAVPRMPLPVALRDRRVVGASLVFIVINLLAIIGFGQLGEAGSIAWEAHLGGYLFGFLAFSYFDIAPQNHSLFDEVS